MKKITGIILILFFAVGLYAQQAITSTGGSKSNSNGTIEFSVGEVAISSYSNPYGSIHEGVIQNHLLVTDKIIQIADLHISVYPNPVVSFLKIKLPDSQKYVFQLYSSSGELIQKNVCNQNQEIDFQNLSQGLYNLQILNTDTRQYNSYSIVKQ